MDENLFKILNQQGSADQYFFPQTIAQFKESKNGVKLTFRQGMRSRTNIGGIRLNEWDPTGHDPTREKACQYDLSKMVEALRVLRKDERYSGCVLSDEYTCIHQQEDKHGKRIKFGLFNPSSPKFQDDAYAAKICHRRIMKSIRYAGFTVEYPKSFDPATGMGGLHAWTEIVRLRRKRRLWPWLFLLLPLLLLLLFIPSCDKIHLLDMVLRSETFILVIDRSGSMEEEMPYVREQMGIFLDTLIGGNMLSRRYYGNIISYTSSADSALGRIEEIDDRTSLRLQEYLSHLNAGGDTVLRSAIDLAAQEVREHGKPTTLFVVTDARDDNSINEMIANYPDIKNQFGGVEVYINSTTPRIINATPELSDPIDEGEKDLKELTELFGGTFGRIRKEQ